MCISGQSHRMSGKNTKNRLLQPLHKFIFLFFLNQQEYVLKLEASLSSQVSAHNYLVNRHTLHPIQLPLVRQRKGNHHEVAFQ